MKFIDAYEAFWVLDSLGASRDGCEDTIWDHAALCI